MTSSNTLTPISIRHKQIPIKYFIHSEQIENDDTNLSVIDCQILSNSYFYAAFLNELTTSSQFAQLFSQLLNQITNRIASKLNRTHLHHLFSIVHHRQHRFYLQVHPHINRYDLWINRLW